MREVYVRVCVCECVVLVCVVWVLHMCDWDIKICVWAFTRVKVGFFLSVCAWLRWSDFMYVCVFLWFGMGARSVKSLSSAAQN